jgi:Rad52/22 family double-strand break repair protein
MNRALLEKPFGPAQIRQRKGRNGVLDYVEGHSVIQRLNEALEGAWSFEITHHEMSVGNIKALSGSAARSQPHRRSESAVRTRPAFRPGAENPLP